jgi:hypothetical protein
MTLFSRDLFRSFLLGFGLTAAIMVASILPPLGGA